MNKALTETQAPALLRGGGYRCTCPHCGHPCRIRHSIAIHTLYRNLFAQCTNAACSATYKLDLEFTHVVSPSGTPNPDIHLPDAPYAMKRLASATTQQTSQIDWVDQAAAEEEPS